MSDVRPTDDEPTTASAPRRLSRFAPQTVARRFAVSKFWRVLAALVITGGVLVSGGSTLTRTVLSWVRKRPEYVFTLERVRFNPPPPAWIIGGRERLTECLRPFATGKNSTLDLSLADLHAELSKSPWVKHVERVSRAYPNIVEVRLSYRVPVARVNREGKRPLVLDADGVVLPDDLDLNAAGPLIAMVVASEPGEIPRGLSWPKTEPQGERVVQCARLAGFLAEKAAADPDVLPPLDRLSLYPKAAKGLWIELAEASNFLYWGSGPDLETIQEPSRETKWQLLKSRVKSSGPLKPIPGKYYKIAKDGIVSVATP